jgi:hypothetical protein
MFETVAKIQNGKSYTTIGDDYCTNGSAGDGAYNRFGGDKAAMKSSKRGAVLAMSLSTDGSMGWLDEIADGSCPSPGGKDGVLAKNKDAYVELSEIHIGDIDSTWQHTYA